MSSVNKIDHIAILVNDIEAALTFWQDALGLTLDHEEEIVEQEARVAFLPLGESEIELVTPTTVDSGIARYLQKHGPGMHHLCFQVDDIQATLAHLKRKSIRMINDQPLAMQGGRKMAFIHPESANGVLVELYELPKPE